MTFFSRFASPFVLFSLGFLWIVLFRDLTWSVYVLGCGATAGGMMALISSSHVSAPVSTGRWFFLLGAACAGAAAALLWGLSLSPVTVGVVALLMLHVVGVAGLWLILRADRAADHGPRGLDEVPS